MRLAKKAKCFSVWMWRHCNCCGSRSHTELLEQPQPLMYSAPAGPQEPCRGSALVTPSLCGAVPRKV